MGADTGRTLARTANRHCRAERAYRTDMPNRWASLRSTTLSDQAIRCWPACLAIALTLMLCTWAIGVPRYGAPDELAHTVKAYGTAHGETIGSAVPDGSPLTRYFDVPAGLLTGDPGCFAFYPQLNASCSIAANDPRIIQYATSAATYPPEYYAVVGGTSRLLGAEESVLSYRLISMLIAAALLTSGLYFMRRAGGRNAGLALVALTPMTIFISTSTNPASTELAGTFLLWAYVAALLARDEVASRRQLLLASSIAAGVVLVRPVALPWVAIALGAYLVLERRRFAGDRRSTTRLLGLCSLPLVAAVVLSSAWSRYAGVGLTDDKYVVADPTTAIFRVGLGRTSELFRQAFGTLGWLDTALPTPTYVLWIACLVLIAALVAFGTDRRGRLTRSGVRAIWVPSPPPYLEPPQTPPFSA